MMISNKKHLLGSTGKRGIKNIFSPILLTFAFVSASSCAAIADNELSKLVPDAEQETANVHIARQFMVSHYRKQPIDSQLSERVFNSYLKALDPQKLYFLAADIQSFEPYRFRLDGALKTGQLDPAFTIYNRFQERLIERLKYQIELVNAGLDKLDFNKQETIENDREQSPWLTTLDAQNDLWRKRVKNAALALELSGKALPEAQESLKKRYESQLNRVYQTRSEDAFQIYMNAFAGVYDPHTNYFSPQTSENFNINMSLSLEGIGAVLQTDNEYTKVIRLVPAGPASKQGQLQTSDRIVGVGQGEDGEVVDVVGWRLDEVVALIRGPAKSIVRLQIIPSDSKDDSQTRMINIVRDKVKLEEQAAQSQVLEVDRNGKKYRMGVIDIPAFYADFRGAQNGDPEYRSTTRDVRRLLNEMNAQGPLDGLIIDLRNNGGGSLQEANMLTGLFIKDGPTVQIRGANDKIDVMEDPDPELVYGGPLVVMVNRLSASASEIFAGAIQDYGRGVILGSQSFGKGTVQSVKPLNHGQIKLTQAKFYRISGGSTQHKGVMPDLLVPSAIDSKEIGEDALPEALPWDYIKEAPHTRYGLNHDILAQLAARHDDRFQQKLEYKILLEEISWLETQREKRPLSLNRETRLQEQKQATEKHLSLVNKRRLAKGELPFANKDEWEAFEKAQANDTNKKKELDFVIQESGEVLVDLIGIQNTVASQQNPQ
ncbi:MAG: carboxy terminal-processing peptidase [Hahellaceae bacterium]|nr:carboxy terminal-processing peptidase [Hahellaceae bacterium]